MQWLDASTATRKQIIPVYLAAVWAESTPRGQPGCLQARRRSEARTRRLFNAGVPSETADLSRRGQAGQRQLCYGSRMLVAPPDPVHVRPINGIILPRTAGCI